MLQKTVQVMEIGVIIRYQQEAAAAQQHQLAVANAQSMMKQEDQEQSTGPLYPRSVFNFRSVVELKLVEQMYSF